MNRIKRIPLFSVLVLMLVASLTTIVGAAEPSDVPPDHWAYQAVRDLVERGYLPLDEQQAFRGDEPVDRYTLAALTAQILEAIESGGAGISDPQDVRTLQRLIEELREDLVTYYAEVQLVQGRVEVVERTADDFFSKLDEVILGMGTLYRRAQELEDALALLGDEQRAALAEEVAKLQLAIDILAGSLQDDMGALQGEIDQLSVLLDTHIRQAEEEQAALRAEIADLLRDLRFDAQSMIDELADEVDGLSARLDSEKATLLKSFEDLESRLEAALLQHGMELGATSEEIERFGEEVLTRTQVLAASIEELAQKLDRLESNLQIQAAAIEVIQGQIEEQITREIAQIDSVIRDLSAALAELETAVNAQEQKQSAFATALEELRGSLGNQSDDIAQLQANLDASVVALQNELAERQAAHEALQAQIRQLVEQIVGLEADTDAELNALGEALSIIDRDLEQKQSQLEDIESALQELVDYFERLNQEQTLALSVAESVLQEALAAIQEELALQAETVAAHERLLIDLAQQLVDQRVAQQNLESRVESLELTAAALGVQAETLAAADAELLQLIEDLQAENTELKERLATLESNFELLIQLLEDELANIGEDIRILKSQVGFSDEELMMLTREVQNRMAEDLQSALLRERELERGLERLRAEFESFREASEKDIGSLRTSQYLSIGALVIGILGLVGN